MSTIFFAETAQSDHRKSLAELNEALALLDKELEGLKMGKPLQVRAVGGYALMAHGVRSEPRAMTVDIDTLTKNYSTRITDAIHTVAEKLGLEKDWLNNDAVLDNDDEHAMRLIDAHFDSYEPCSGLKNIQVSVGDVPTLTRSKLIATNDANLSNREQDSSDLRELISFQGIETMAQFRKAYPGAAEEMPNATAVVTEFLGGRSALKRLLARAEEFEDEELFDNLDADEFEDDQEPYDEGWGY